MITKTITCATLDDVRIKLDDFLATRSTIRIYDIRLVVLNDDFSPRANYQVTLDYDEDGEALSLPYFVNVYEDKTSEGVEAAIAAYKAANPTVYVAGVLAGQSLSRDDYYPFVAVVVANPSASEGERNYATRSVGSTSRWTEIDSSRYTATPASTSQIDMSDTSNLNVNLPVVVEQASGLRYARITGVAPDANILISGDALNIAEDIDRIVVGTPEMLIALTLPVIAAAYAAAPTATLIADETSAIVQWSYSRSKVVDFSVVHVTDDSTTAPRVNLIVDGNALSTEDTNNGQEVTTSLNTNGVNIDSANNTIQANDVIELSVTVAGGTGDAAGLNTTVYAVPTL